MSNPPSHCKLLQFLKQHTVTSPKCTELVLRSCAVWWFPWHNFLTWDIWADWSCLSCSKPIIWLLEHSTCIDTQSLLCVYTYTHIYMCMFISLYLRTERDEHRAKERGRKEKVWRLFISDWGKIRVVVVMDAGVGSTVKISHCARQYCWEEKQVLELKREE